MEEKKMEVARDGSTVIPTPKWVLAVRIVQFILSLIVVIMAGWFIHGLYLDALGFAIACAVFTWVIFFYAVLTERVLSCHVAYNTWAILSIDGFMIILWLTSMAYVAWTRTQFKYTVSAICSSDGSLVNSGHCTITKRSVDGVATKGALDVVSAIAGVSAIELLLFVATSAYLCHQFRIFFPVKPDAEQALPQIQQPGGGMVAPQQQPQVVYVQQPQQDQQPQFVYVQQPGVAPGQPQMVYAQQPGFAPQQPQQEQQYVQPQATGSTFSPDQVGHPQQSMYAAPPPQGTPSPVYPQQQQGPYAAPQPVSPDQYAQQYPAQQQQPVQVQYAPAPEQSVAQLPTHQ